MLATTKLQFFGYGKLIISSFKGYNDTCLDTMQSGHLKETCSMLSTYRQFFLEILGNKVF